MKGIKGWGTPETREHTYGADVITTGELVTIFGRDRSGIIKRLRRHGVSAYPLARTATGETLWPRREALAALTNR